MLHPVVAFVTIAASVALLHVPAAHTLVNQLPMGPTTDVLLLVFVRRGIRGDGVKHAFASALVAMVVRACWQLAERFTLGGR